MSSSFAGRDELRLLLALPPELWGADAERQLVAHLAQTLQGQTRRLRLRTFSEGHLDKARQSFERLGLGGHQAPWQRWIVSLDADENGEEPAEPDRRRGENFSVWPPQSSQVEQSRGGGTGGQAAKVDKQETDEGDEESG